MEQELDLFYMNPTVKLRPLEADFGSILENSNHQKNPKTECEQPQEQMSSPALEVFKL